jgi:hypothetical protein
MPIENNLRIVQLFLKTKDLSNKPVLNRHLINQNNCLMGFEPKLLLFYGF